MSGQLSPASKLANKVSKESKPYPNESAAYREARTKLLVEEIELRRQIERVAQHRRAMPPGGEIPQDYELIGEDNKRTTLTQIFGKHDTLVSYFWMFGPQRERPCPMCTSFVRSMDLPARDIEQRVAFAILGSSPIERQIAFKKERGWHNLRFFQLVTDDFARDYRALQPNGDEWASFDVFTKKDGKVRHFWGAEMGGTQDPGQDPRLAPNPTPLWNILDLTPAGRDAKWYPKLNYEG